MQEHQHERARARRATWHTQHVGEWQLVQRKKDGGAVIGTVVATTKGYTWMASCPGGISVGGTRQTYYAAQRAVRSAIQTYRGMPDQDE